MDEIIKKLRYAMENQALVNVIQVDSSIFYTGAVISIDRVGTILSTYTDDGLTNGYVYLKYLDIFDVDFYSDDLSKMETQMKLVKSLDLLSTEQPEIKLNKKVDLLTQVLGSAFVYQQPLLIIQTDNSMIEGFVSAIGKHQVEMMVFDKFNSGNVKRQTIGKSQIQLVEFKGRELNLLANSKKLLLTNHVQTETIQGSLAIFATLHRSFELGRRVIMIPKINPELFFIGQVKAVNADAVIFAVVDMNGQFGGYELIRLEEIDRIETKSDYLRLINHFVSLNMAQVTYLQPVLNDDRSFDATVDLFVAITEQAINFKQFLRIKTNDGESYFGVPFKLEKGKLSVRYLDKDKPTEPQLKELNLANIDELAFGYLDTFLEKKRIMDLK
ncbi:hypothetical protein R4B61_03345 [Fructilactobacillus vespulae]|uniref:hypothetical protein n=1 Tax=Fructilactobacillus vespulae TaxID=1249630 RepID=UPI0039B4FF15